MARILMVLRPDRGGVFTHVSRLSAALADRGHDVFVCGPVAHRADSLPEATVIPLDIPREINPISDLRALRRLSRIIGAAEPDLVHLHGSQAGALGRLAKVRHARLPVVFTPHLYAFDNYFAEARQRHAYKLIERGLAPFASRVLCVCEAERDLALAVGPDNRVRMVYNGTPRIADNDPHPALAALPPETRLIGTVAELRQSKGVETLVEAMPAILDSIPDAHLAVAGDGPERENIEALVGRLGLDQNVTLLGHTDGPSPLLSAVELFVNPAFAEAFPYTIIEAMSTELPVVATDVGGSAEAVLDGETGLVVAPESASALAEAISSLLTDRDRLYAMGKAGKARYEEMFTLEKMVDGTLGVYDELL